MLPGSVSQLFLSFCHRRPHCGPGQRPLSLTTSSLAPSPKSRPFHSTLLTAGGGSSLNYPLCHAIPLEPSGAPSVLRTKVKLLAVQPRPASFSHQGLCRTCHHPHGLGPGRAGCCWAGGSPDAELVSRARSPRGRGAQNGQAQWVREAPELRQRQRLPERAWGAYRGCDCRMGSGGVGGGRREGIQGGRG